MIRLRAAGYQYAVHTGCDGKDRTSCGAGPESIAAPTPTSCEPRPTLVSRQSAARRTESVRLELGVGRYAAHESTGESTKRRQDGGATKPKAPIEKRPQPLASCSGQEFARTVARTKPPPSA